MHTDDVIARIFQLGAYIAIFIGWGLTIGLFFSFFPELKTERISRISPHQFWKGLVTISTVTGTSLWLLDLVFGFRLSFVVHSILFVPYIVGVLLLVPFVIELKK